MNTDILYKQASFLNSLLQENISQKIKAKTCYQIEAILFKTDTYAGFNYLYWSTPSKHNPEQDGYDLWIQAGKPSFPEKHKFVTGPNYAEFMEKCPSNILQHETEFCSDIEGEYSRYYNLSRIL